MSALEIGFWSFPVLLILILLRLPIGLAMFTVGILGTWLVSGMPNMVLSNLKHTPFGTFSNYSLSIVPLFLLMSQFAMRSGMSASLFRVAEAWMGHLRGGVAMSAVGACAGFGAICGSSLATASSMGQVALPEMRKYGYDGGLATATLAAGGTLGILIPPSVILVIYAILTEQNIAKLFVAALIPGLLAAVTYMLVISLYGYFKPSACGQRREKSSMSERWVALLNVWPVLVIFLGVVGGIYLGIFTPTEAAAVGAAATGLYAFFTGNLNLKSILDSIGSTAISTAMIFLIVLGASFFNSFIALTQVPQFAANLIVEQAFNPWLVLTIVLAMYLVFGCIMDSLSMILLTVPIFFPLMMGLDFGMSAEDFGLWFGILVLIVVEVGLITPPVGMNLFIINNLARDIPVLHTFRAVIPFVAGDLIRVVILVLFPPITLGLVWLMH